MADIRLPFEFPSSPNEVQANFQALYDFITNVEAKTEAFKNLQIADGTTVKFTTDTTGNVTQPVNPSFKGHNGSTQALSSNVLAVLNMTTEDTDVGGNYDPTTETFTAPVAGTYAFTVVATVSVTSGTGRTTISITKNFSGSATTLGSNSLPFVNASETYSVTVTVYALLAAGDTVTPTYSTSLGAVGSGTLQVNSYFTGTLVN